MQRKRYFVLCLAMAGIMGACGDDSGKTDSDVLQAENTEDLCKDG